MSGWCGSTGLPGHEAQRRPPNFRQQQRRHLDRVTALPSGTCGENDDYSRTTARRRAVMTTKMRKKQFLFLFMIKICPIFLKNKHFHLIVFKQIFTVLVFGILPIKFSTRSIQLVSQNTNTYKIEYKLFRKVKKKPYQL